MRKGDTLFPQGRYIVYVDGGARGNPGPAAIGVVIGLPGQGGKKYSEKIGRTTNNVAEYQAIIFALRKLKALIGKKQTKNAEVEIRMDSQLAANQLNGKFKIKDSDLQPLFIEVWNLKQDFKNVSFIHIPREENKKADKLVNEALNLP